MLAPRLVGRDAQLDELRQAMSVACDGRGGLMFVAGEAGIGKSRLTAVAAAEAGERGCAVLRGRAVHSRTPVAYRPLTEALCSAVRAGGVADAPGLAPFRAILGPVVPDWRGLEPESGGESVVAVAEGVVRFLRALAGDVACLLVLEDLHWADPETLTVVEYLADNLRLEPALVVVTLRTEDRGPAAELARSLEARRAAGVIALHRLSSDEVADMVGMCLDAERVANEVLAFADRADGVPFLVEELLGDAIESGALVRQGETWVASGEVGAVIPLTFADSMRRRLDALGSQARRVLLAAAVLGRRFDWQLLPATTTLGEDDVFAALRAAVDGQMLVADDEVHAFRFRHALSRDAVLAQLLPPERVTLSRRALEVIEAAHPALDGDWCELAAELASMSGDRPRAVRLMLELGRRAVDAGALASAELSLERARTLAATDDAAADVEESLLEVLSLAGKRDDAAAVGASLLARLTEPAAAVRRARAQLQLARAAVAATDWDDANGCLEGVRTEARLAADEGLMARADAVGAQAAIGREPHHAAALARRALDAAERLSLPEVACEALEILGRYERARDLDAAEAAFARAYDLADAHRLGLWRLRALHERATIDLLRDGSLTRLDQARDLAVAQGAMATAAVLDIQIAACVAMQDDPEPALIAARRAAQIARRYRLVEPLAAALGFEAHVHARAGRKDDMGRCLHEAIAQGRGSPDIDVLGAFTLGLAALIDEDRASARPELERAKAIASDAVGDRATGPALGLWALVCAIDGDNEAVDVAVALHPVHFMARGYLRYAQAVVAGRVGAPNQADALLAEGDQCLGNLEWHRQLGRRLVSEASLADGWGDPVVWLREALAFFDGRGDDRLASACRSLLRRAGAAVPRRRSGAAVPGRLRAMGVTDREAEVLGLLADGLSNQEIAARLYLSPRTVERHIANLTVKVGVERRAQLVAFAARVAASPT